MFGCSHPKFTGSTQPRPSDGTGPSVPVGQAQIISASPASVVAGSDVGVTYTSTAAPVTGNEDFSISKVAVAANDLEWDSTSRKIYVSVGSANGISVDSIATLDPQTAMFDSFTSTGSQPGASSEGVKLQSQAQIDGRGNHIHSEPVTGYLYKDGGAIIDPTTGALVGQFPLTAVQGGFRGNPVMVPDGKLNIAYFVGQTVNGGASNYVIEAFDLTQFTLLGYIPVASFSGTPSKVIRWGNNGLAILTDDASSAATGKGIYLVNGGFVTSPAP